MKTEFADGIHWVGCIDWTVRDFHSYNTERGTTYNAYLIEDESCALIDAVKAPYAESLLWNIRERVDLTRVKYVVCNHAEPDHSGALPEVMRVLPDATLLCNTKCARALCQHYDTSAWNIREVSEEDIISLGRYSLRFVNTPLVHWPESMFTYVPEVKLLFSMDAFGQHYASVERFDDEAPLHTIMEEAKTYYANIVLPYGKSVLRALNTASDFDIDTIATSHGISWRSHKKTILESYTKWAAGEFEPKVLVIFDTMWESTARMADAIVEGAAQDGVTVKLIHLRRTSLTRIATDILDAAAVAFGSATLNGTMMPSAGAALTYLRGLKAREKAGIAFGSYGWGKGGPEAIHEQLEAMKWELLREPLKAQYRPTPEVLEECRKCGAALAAKALEKAGI